MSVDFTLNAEPRADVGKGASRRLRRAGRVPAVIYGGHEDPKSITLAHNELIHELANEAFYSSVLTIDLAGRKEQAVLRDVQRHPYKPTVLHIDLMRIRADQAITMNVPLHFVNEERCVGVRQQGGILTHALIDVEVLCLPKDLPEYIEVDVSELELNGAIHLSELKLPSGVQLVELTHDEESINDSIVVSVHHAQLDQGDGGEDDGSEAGEDDHVAED